MLSKEGAKFLLKAILKPILIKILVFEYKHYELSAFMQKNEYDITFGGGLFKVCKRQICR